jgi:hypothetical protein
MTTRRGFIAGIGALLCAPAIVRASSLMPLSFWRVPGLYERVMWGDAIAQTDIEKFIADEVLPLAKRQLQIYQFDDPLMLPPGTITHPIISVHPNYTATRWAPCHVYVD